MADNTTIGLSVGIGVLGLALVATVLIKSGKVRSPTDGPNFTMFSGVGRFFFAIANFIPFGLVLFGFIADMISQEFRYSISSIVAIVTMIINYFAGNALGNRMNVDTIPMAGGADSRWCSIPGLEGLESTTLPMNISTTVSIVLYYVWFAIADRPVGENISLFAGLGAILIAQIISFASSGCSEYFTAIKGNMAYNMVIAILLGITCSAIAFSSVHWGAPEYSPFTTVGNVGKMGGLQSTGGLPPVKSGLSAPPTGGKCSPVEGGEEDAMVCEAYRNGQLVTDTLT
jgi:hypothetical protein